VNTSDATSAPRRPHDHVGIESLGFALAAVVCLVVTFALGRRRGVLDAMDPDVYEFVPGNIDPETLAFDTGAAACGTVAFALVAITIGVVGVWRRRQRRTLSLLGIATATATILVLVALVAVGSAIG